jgi:ABC-type transport system involved in cytochrome bd biosynthesis fused ATPase/permease subunit
MSLITVSRKYCMNHPLIWYLIIIIGINNIVINIISTELLLRDNVEKWFLLLELIRFVLDTYLINPLILHIAHTIKKTFIHDAYSKYDTMSFESKNKHPMSEFERVMREGTNVIFLMVEWCIPTISKILGVSISTGWLFYRKNILHIAGAILIIMVFLYFTFIIKKQTAYNKNAFNNRKDRRHNFQKINMNLAPFQYKERTVEYMYNIHENITNGNQTSINENQSIKTWIKLGAKISTMIVCYLFINTPSEFLMIFMNLNKINSVISEVSNFSTQWNRMCDEFNTYQKSFAGAEFKTTPEPMYQSPNLVIDNINIVRKCGFSVVSNTKINFFTGVKILIRGSSGHGKSTLLNGINGKILGVSFNIGTPENYYHDTVDMYQEIREKLPSSKITIRDYFQDEPDNALIEFYLRNVFEDNEYNNWVKSINTIGDIHIYDTYIDNKISGGQKSRLILATRAYEVDIKKRHIIILDEPEQGSDPATSIKVLNWFFKRYHDKTIIMVSHLCDCQLKKLTIDWNYNLLVENGSVNHL